VSEVNSARTEEELQKIRAQFQNNEIIQRDFGGKGTLWPATNRSTERWNNSVLDFLQPYGSRIMGYSAGSAQRGRHPIFGIIDDPEERDTIRNPEIRKEYFTWLFQTFLPMFQAGGKVVWIGTIIDQNSCLMMALDGVREVEDDIDEEDRIRDERFSDWNRHIWEAIYDDEETGERRSIFPDYLSVEGFDAKVESHGLQAAMAEFQGSPIAAGQFAFHRDPFLHAYARCERRGGDQPGDLKEYMLDLKTGVTMPWDEFLSGLRITGACDIANSTARTADYSACVIIGVDPNGVIYVLDVFAKRWLADRFVVGACDIASEWVCPRLYWEIGALQDIVYRLAKRYASEREAEHRFAPRCLPVNNTARNKEQRILATIRPLIARREIRFLASEVVQTGDGEKHIPVHCAHKAYHRMLMRQLDGYTDEGGTSFDDAIDALEMAIRKAGTRRGQSPEAEDENERQLREWREAGVHWSPHLIPPEARPPSVIRELAEAAGPGLSTYKEIDPYD